MFFTAKGFKISYNYIMTIQFSYPLLHSNKPCIKLYIKLTLLNNNCFLFSIHPPAGLITDLTNLGIPNNPVMKILAGVRIYLKHMKYFPVHKLPLWQDRHSRQLRQLSTYKADTVENPGTSNCSLIEEHIWLLTSLTKKKYFRPDIFQPGFENLLFT
jgi:hypothetical protein